MLFLLSNVYKKTLAIWNPVMASTPLFNSSNLDELFVLNIHDKIIDEKSPKSRDNDQK